MVRVPNPAAVNPPLITTVNAAGASVNNNKNRHVKLLRLMNEYSELNIRRHLVFQFRATRPSPKSSTFLE